jgi:hypothetical protein
MKNNQADAPKRPWPEALDALTAVAKHPTQVFDNMRKAKAMAAVAALATVAMFGQESAPKAPAPRPITPLAWRVGGVWTADASKMTPGMRIETRYTWSDNSAYIRFTTHFVSEKGTLKNYDGQFFWNPEQPALEVWYMDARNHITQGPVAIKGDVVQIAFRAEDFQGKMADLRVQVTRRTNDHYTWTLEEKQAQGWSQLASLEYLRVAEK